MVSENERLHECGGATRGLVAGKEVVSKKLMTHGYVLHPGGIARALQVHTDVFETTMKDADPDVMKRIEVRSWDEEAGTTV